MFVPVLSTEVRDQRRADYDNLITTKKKPDHDHQPILSYLRLLRLEMLFVLFCFKF